MIKILSEAKKVVKLIFLLPFLLCSILFAYGLGEGIIGEFLFYGEIKDAVYIETKSSRTGSGHQPLYTASAELVKIDKNYKDTIECSFQFGRNSKFYENLGLFIRNAKKGDIVKIKTITNYRGRLLMWNGLEIKSSSHKPLGTILVFCILLTISVFCIVQFFSILFNFRSLMNKTI